MLYKGCFNWYGQMFTLYTHAVSVRKAFRNFCYQLSKKVGYSEAFVRSYFDQQKIDNWIINEDENYKKGKEVHDESCHGDRNGGGVYASSIEADVQGPGMGMAGRPKNLSVVQPVHGRLSPAGRLHKGRFGPLRPRHQDSRGVLRDRSRQKGGRVEAVVGFLEKWWPSAEAWAKRGAVEEILRDGQDQDHR